MDVKEVTGLIVVVLIFLTGIVYFVYRPTLNDALTGNVVAQEGSTSKEGPYKIANPNKGALKGRVIYTISDGSNTIDEEKASNEIIYFASTGKKITDYSLIKKSSEEYEGTLDNVDADDSESTCSQAGYTTTANYYDENNDNVEAQNEFSVYSVTTDANGCYAVKLPAGAYDIFV